MTLNYKIKREQLIAASPKMLVALLKIAEWPLDSEPVGGAMAMQDIAREATEFVWRKVPGSSEWNTRTFYCEKCRVKNNWPESLDLVSARCGICREVAICYDYPTNQLGPKLSRDDIKDLKDYLDKS